MSFSNGETLRTLSCVFACHGQSSMAYVPRSTSDQTVHQREMSLASSCVAHLERQAERQGRGRGDDEQGDELPGHRPARRSGLVVDVDQGKPPARTVDAAPTVAAML